VSENRTKEFPGPEESGKKRRGVRKDKGWVAESAEKIDHNEADTAGESSITRNHAKNPVSRTSRMGGTTWGVDIQ